MATTTITPDLENDPKLETMPLEELRKLAEKNAQEQSTNTEENETPSEENKETAGEEEQVETKEFVAQKSFDLGDGAGAQVYKGHGATKEEALEDLSNKLIEAQKNATKRIKELKTTTKTQEPTVSKEDAALLAAEMVKDPVATVEKILKLKGLDPDSLKESAEFVKTQKVTNTRKSAADAFVKTHPDYVDSTKNAAKINKWCELNNDFSLEGMNKAYQDLNESGLLEVKGEEAGQRQEENKSGTRTEEKTQVTPPPVTKKASGISTHRRSAAPVVTEPSEDELYSMPLEKLRTLSNKVLAGQ